MFKIFAIVFVVLVGLTSIFWGFPGGWALTAIVPSFIVAATLRHLRQEPNPESGKRLVRPTVMTMGFFFSFVSGAASVMLMWSATSSSLVVITVDQHIDMQRNVVWETLNDEHQRWRGQTWLASVEGYGKGGGPQLGSKFRSMMQFEGHQAKGDHVVDVHVEGSTFGWTIAPAGGSRLKDIHELVTLTDAKDGGTVVQYQLRYTVDSVFGRMIERLTIRRSLEKAADHAMSELQSKVLQ